MSKQHQGQLEDGVEGSAGDRTIVFAERSGNSAIRALAILRGVRTSSTERSSLRAAIDLALKQGVDFEWLSEDPAPIERVQVLLEGQLMMTVSPEDASARLRAFRFDTPVPEGSVMQIVTADRGEEPVVLLNLALNEIPRDGIDHAWSLPNGQQMRLMIERTEENRFDVLVAFVQEKALQEISSQSIGVEETGRIEQSQRTRERWFLGPPFFTVPRLAWALCACVSMIFGTWALRLQPALISYKDLSQDRFGDVSLKRSVTTPPRAAGLQTLDVPANARRNSVSTSRLKPKQNINKLPDTYIAEITLTSSGTRSVDNNKITTIPRHGTLRLSMKLPDGSASGMYDVTLRDAAGNVVFGSTAKSVNGKKIGVEPSVHKLLQNLPNSDYHFALSDRSNKDSSPINFPFVLGHK
jgi:hypothetical protein